MMVWSGSSRRGRSPPPPGGPAPPARAGWPSTAAGRRAEDGGDLGPRTTGGSRVGTPRPDTAPAADRVLEPRRRTRRPRPRPRCGSAGRTPDRRRPPRPRTPPRWCRRRTRRWPRPARRPESSHQPMLLRSPVSGIGSPYSSYWAAVRPRPASTEQSALLVGAELAEAVERATGLEEPAVGVLGERGRVLRLRGDPPGPVGVGRDRRPVARDQVVGAGPDRSGPGIDAPAGAAAAARRPCRTRWVAELGNLPSANA